MKKLLLFLLLSFIAVNCSKGGGEYLKIGTNVWIGYEPLYLARELGFYKHTPVHLVEYASSSQVIRAYRNRIINGAALTLDETLLLRDYGFNPVVVLVMDISNGADAIVARKGINSLKELKGKRIGVENSALGAYVLTRALEIAGLTPADVEIVSLEVNEHYDWFVEGKVDAVVTFEPVKSKLLKVGGKVIFDSSQIPGEIVDVLVIEKEYIDKYPEIVSKVVDGWFSALRFMEKSRNSSLKMIAQREHIPVKDLIKAYRGIEIPDKHVNLLLLNHSEPKLKTVALKLLEIMYQKKIISRKDINVDDLFDSRFIKGF